MPPPPAALRLAELTRARCREIAPDALLVWPVGATEQHGPHLPVGTDAMHAEWVATRAADLGADQIPVVIARRCRSAHRLITCRSSDTMSSRPDLYRLPST